MGNGAIDLTGEWMLADVSGQYDLPVKFPGDGISALHDAGLIPDPYFGRNEYDLRWIAERDWVARRSVTLAEDACELVLSGLDTVVDVRVNGRHVLAADNMFRTWRVDLAGIARPGENEIELLFRSAPREAARRQDAHPYFVPWSTNCCQIPNMGMLRKQQCDFGWDWGICLAPFGVYGDMRIEPRRTVRIEGVLVAQEHRAGSATIHVDIPFVASAAGSADWEIALCGQVARGRVEIYPGKGRVSATLNIEDPALWWPVGQGAQPLHEMQIRLGAETATRRIGLRDTRLVTERDETGLGFKFRVNGRDIFAKGANWVPADALAGRITREGVRELLQSAVDANMNMIRVWGGGRYEPDWFYDMCDEFGLMVWQDFMFSCNHYPCDEPFLANVREEVRENVLRLNHHACLSLWCGDNEMIGALNEFEVSRVNRDLYLVAYDRLNRTIETGLKELLPDANWWPSSPSLGPLDFGDAWHRCDSGDMHSWEVWHEGKDFEHYRTLRPRFCSEFGFQSYPSMPVIRRFAAPQDMNIASPVMESHQKNAGGNARIAQTMFRYFRFPVDFENFTYVSQVQQGLAIKTAIDYWRSLKPHCMGTLIWQLNDTWPVCSWSSIDHGGDWKLLHYMAREFFAPVVVTVAPGDDGYSFRAVSDLPEAVDVALQVFALSPNGAMRALAQADFRISPRAADDVMTIAPGKLGENELLWFSWLVDGREQSDLFSPVRFKALNLLPAEISRSVRKEGRDWVVELKSTNLALFVALEADQPGRFSRNGFHLLPGRPARVRFSPRADGPAPNFVIRDLQAATGTSA